MLKNFTAASRKRNTQAFGLLPSIPTWIEDNISSLSAYTVPSSATPVFEATNGSVQRLTVDQNIAPIFKYAGSQSSGVPYFPLWIRFQMSGGPWYVQWPSNVSIDANYQLGPNVTVIGFWWNGSAWECFAPPVENP